MKNLLGMKEETLFGTVKGPAAQRLNVSPEGTILAFQSGGQVDYKSVKGGPWKPLEEVAEDREIERAFHQLAPRPPKRVQEEAGFCCGGFLRREWLRAFRSLGKERAMARRGVVRHSGGEPPTIGEILDIGSSTAAVVVPK